MTCSCGKPTSGAHLCDDCALTFRWAIVNIAAHYADLATVVRKQAHYGSGGPTTGSIGAETPIPVDHRFTGTRTHGAQLRWDAWNTVVAWCRTVMEDQPELHGPAHDDCLDVSCSAVRRRRWPANTVPSMCRYLARQFRYLLGEPWAPDMLDEFLDLERRLTRMVDRPADRWYAGPCTVGQDDLSFTALCGADLYAALDRDEVTCRECGWTYQVAERRAWLLAAAEDRWETATVIARAVVVFGEYERGEHRLVKRIGQWVDAGRLAVRDRVEVGGRVRPAYRIGDVMDRLAEDVEHEAGKRKAGRSA